MNKTPNDKIDITEIMKKAQDMQKKLQEIQKKVAEMEVIGSAGGDLLKIYLTGTHRATKAVLDPKILDEEKSVIEDLICAAINDGNAKIEKLLRDKMGGLAGIKLPDDTSK